MNDQLKIVIVLVVITLGLEVVRAVLKNKYSNQLTEVLIKGDFEKFDELVENKLVKYLIPPFNLDYLKLNRYLLENNKGKIVEIFDSFANKRLRDKQKVDVYTQGFNYFLAAEDKERCAFFKQGLDELNDEILDPKIKEAFGLSYDVIIEGKTDSLDMLLEETAKLDDPLKGANEYLISKIYKNLGNNKKSKEYDELAAKHMVLYEQMMAEQLTQSMGTNKQ